MFNVIGHEYLCNRLLFCNKGIIAKEVYLCNRLVLKFSFFVVI